MESSSFEFLSATILKSHGKAFLVMRRASRGRIARRAGETL